jgi:hypothetical protein
MEDLTINILWIVATWAVASFIIGFLEAYQAVDAELRTKIHQHLNDIIHRVHCETRNGVLYWFDSDDNEFLAQGNNYEELTATLKARYPKHMFYFEQDNEQFLVASNTDWKPVKLTETTI